MEKKNILKKSGLYLIGNFSSKMLASLLFPLYAFYISVEDLGQFDFSQALMNIIAPIIFVAIWEGILRFVLSNEEKKEKIISTSLVFSIGVGIFYFCAILIIYFISDNLINDFLLISIMIFCNGISQIWQSYARALKKNKVYVFSGIYSTFINFLFVLILVVFLKKGVEGLYIPYILGNLSIVIYIEKKIKIFQYCDRSLFDYMLLKKILRYSIPLVLNIISMWLITGFSRIIIIENLGLEANGLYAFAMKFSIIVNMIGSVVNMAVIEEVIISLNNKDMGNKFSSIINEIFELFIYGLILLIPFIILFYRMIGNTDYVDSVFIVPPLLVYAVLMSMSTNIGAMFQAKNKTNILFVTTLIGALITVIGSYFFINIFEIYSIIFFQLIGVLAMLISRYVYVHLTIHLRLSCLKIIFLIMIFFIISYIYIYLNIVYSLITLAISYFFVYRMNREKILGLFLHLRNRKTNK